jgi:hypothetical protein
VTIGGKPAPCRLRQWPLLSRDQQREFGFFLSQRVFNKQFLSLIRSLVEQLVSAQRLSKHAHLREAMPLRQIPKHLHLAIVQCERHHLLFHGAPPNLGANIINNIQ